MTRFARLVLVLCCLGAGGAAQAQQPPIQSPQDRACRDEAAGKVFNTPDPQRLGPYAIGRQIYMACMQRAAAPAPGKAARRRPRRA